MEILLLLACVGVFFLAPVAFAIVIFLTQQRSGVQPHPAVPPPRTYPPASHNPVAAAEDADSRQAIVARLTQRFCPGCRAALAADAPEGLCPACLMAGALAGESGPPVNGMAVTTPPSGSQPPASGEWADLAQRFPQLEILELLGRGGMGTVYKVRQKNLDRIIALKVIPPDAAKDPAFAERFARESRAMARLNHPNIVTVYDSGHEGELYWLMMEYVDGVNLRHTLRAGHLQPREALAIVPQICDALQYAHDQGVVHRDIKPENVLLDRTGRVKIADFGLAKLLGKGPDDFTLTRTQQVMGTPRYMAPEQIERPTTVDHRADIYSLGVVLYEMLTGELPLGRFDPPSHKVQVDVRIDQIVLRALEKAPERRYQRASEVKTDLASAASWPALAPNVAAVASVPPPAWNTPAPASKSNPTAYPDPPGGAPLAQVLMVAMGMVVGLLMMTAGLGALIYVILNYPGMSSNAFWGWIGSAIGCIGGGFGSAAGSYNTYRQMAGAVDLMRSPSVTWFDWVLRVYLLVGMLLLAAGLIFPVAPDSQSFPGLLLFGGIFTVQAACFLVWRMSYIAKSAPDPAREAIRRRVAGPAIGLMIAGAIGFLPLLLGLLLAASTTVLVPVGPGQQPEPAIYRESSGVAPKLMIPLLPMIPTPAMVSSAPVLLAAEEGYVETNVTPMWGVLMLAILLLLSLPISILLIIGGWRMRQLKSYGLAMVAAILALLPCSAGWLIGLPMGVWSLAVLRDPAVREAFES